MDKDYNLPKRNKILEGRDRVKALERHRMVKLQRAQGECLGTRSRRKT